jgi:hypothetical protein
MWVGMAKIKFALCLSPFCGDGRTAKNRGPSFLVGLVCTPPSPPFSADDDGNFASSSICSSISSSSSSSSSPFYFRSCLATANGRAILFHSILLLRLRSYREKGKILFQLFPNLFFLLRLIITKCFSFRRNKIIIATVQTATTIFFS